MRPMRGVRRGSLPGSFPPYHTRAGVRFNMAALIPVEGDTLENQPPADEHSIRALLGFDKVKRVTAKDGSTWWAEDPPMWSDPVNVRASSFLGVRCKPDAAPNLFGKVLYLSAEETAALDRLKEALVPVRGKTYDVRDKLKSIGARWDANARVWLVPASKMPEADAIVKKGP